MPRPAETSLPWLAPGLVFGLALAVYGLTAPPGLTWANASADGGDLITAALTLGVPHPSGYPTWTLLAALFSRLPLGTAAWRVTLLSMVSAAAAGALVAAGLGITALPVLALQLVDMRELVAVPLVRPAMARPIGIVTRIGRSLSPATQAFMASLQAAPAGAPDAP